MKAVNGTSSDRKIKNIKSAWSGSAEFGKSYDDRVFVGFELGYLREKRRISSEGSGWKVSGVGLMIHGKQT